MQLRRSAPRSVEQQDLIRSAYLALLRREPDPSDYVGHLAALENGGSVHDLLRHLVETDEFASSRPDDIFGAIWRNLGLLEEIDADLTVPLEACRPYVGLLRMRGPIRDRSVFRWIVRFKGIWEPHVTKFLAGVLRQGDNIVDAGANLGYFTVIGASLVGPSGKVTAFEPLAENFSFCVQNLELNSLTNVKLFANGLWDEHCQKEIVRPEDFLGGAFLAERQEPTDPTGVRQSVDCVKFDDLAQSGEVDISELRLIKIDIEGSETFALQGMSWTIMRKRPLLVVELNPYCLNLFDLGIDAFWNRLTELDYRVMVLPKKTEEALLEKLWLPLRWPEMGLREFETFGQLEEAVQQVNRNGPESFDIVGVPRDSRREPFWS